MLIRSLAGCAIALAMVLSGGAAQPAERYAVVHGWPTMPEGHILGQATGVGVDSHNHVFVFHRAGRIWSEPFPKDFIGPATVSMFDGATGAHVGEWGTNQFVMPHGLSIDAADNVWLTDVGSHQVFKFSHDGKLLLTLGTSRVPGNDATHFNLPTDVAVRPDGGFFVSDGYENTRVVSFSADGAFLSQWGVKGSGAGEFDLPHGIALDAAGRVYVADRSNARVQIFDGGGRFLSQWQQKDLGRPYAVAIGGDGKAYVVDGGDQPQTPPDRSRAMRLALDGRIESTFGRYGNYDGQFMLGHDIAVGRDGAVYVVDAWGQRVQKFTTGTHAPEQTAPQTLLGRGNGIDHVTVMTHDVAAATATYANRLGFNVRPFAKYPDGFENAVAYFADDTFVELFGVHDRVKATASEQAYALNEPEGILWNSLRVESLQRAVDMLRTRSEGAFGPETFPEGAGGDDWMFRLGGLKDRALGGRFMLIEWHDAPLPTDPAKKAARDLRRTHANTARRLHSVWIGVRSLEDAARAYRNLGLPAGRPIEFTQLGAVGHEIAAGTGTILLLQPAGADSGVTASLGSRDDAYMGISVEVSDLQTARAFLRSSTGESFEEYDGRYGRSILVPARQAHGVWIEMFQRATGG